MSRPTLYVTNWSSRKLYGPSPIRLTIMAKPRLWERGEGRVAALVPEVADLESVQHGFITSGEYAKRFYAAVAARGGRDVLVPGALTWTPWTTSAAPDFVVDGDTLCCACSRMVAAEHKCHRVWSAWMLHDAGWRVMLDGVLVDRPVPAG